MGEEAKLPGNAPFQDVRVEGIEASDLALHDSPAPWRVRVGVRQGHKIGWQRGIAVHRYPVLRFRTGHDTGTYCGQYGDGTLQ